jgi:hypothetical protein
MEIFPPCGPRPSGPDAFERTLKVLTQLPYVVGADWFQYYDEPAKGRFDGENFNMGLVGVRDRPYEELNRTRHVTRFAQAQVRAAAATRDGPPGSASCAR